MGVPKEVNIDLGFADIAITNGNEIRFTGKGLQTNVGTRLASNTKGMSVDGGGEYLDSDTDETVSNRKAGGVNRTQFAKKVVSRKTKHKKDEYDSITSLKGLRL